MSTPTLQLEGATLTRVGYLDVPIPPEFVGLDRETIARVPWREPHWTQAEQVRFGAATWVADVAGQRVAFDPVLAADTVLRADRPAEAQHQLAVAQAFAAAGLPRESVDLVVLSHIEGVGMVAWRDDDGSWSPFFPNARVRVSEGVLREFERTDAGAEPDLEREAWRALIAMGRVGVFGDGESVAPGLIAEITDGHCPGHAVLHLRDAQGSSVLTMLGHLAVSPLHLATGECAALNAEPTVAHARLQDIARDGRVLVGPLWPSPGFGRWRDGVLVAGG
jgi:hypothetical protein